MKRSMGQVFSKQPIQEPKDKEVYGAHVFSKQPIQEPKDEEVLEIIVSVIVSNIYIGPPLWCSSQSFWLLTQRFRVRFLALPDFLSNSGSGTGSTQPL
jgi:hypothetical protein